MLLRSGRFFLRSRQAREPQIQEPGERRSLLMETSRRSRRPRAAQPATLQPPAARRAAPLTQQHH
eukprot:COSAG01_NODE_25632_length_739_cov_0.637500_2_plen_64_part_01